MYSVFTIDPVGFASAVIIYDEDDTKLKPLATVGRCLQHRDLQLL